MAGLLTPARTAETLQNLPPEAIQRLKDLAAKDKGALKELGKALLKQNVIKGGIGIAAGLGAGYLAKNYGFGDEMAAEKREEELAQMDFTQRMVERIKDNPGIAAAAGLGTAAALGGAAYYGLNKQASELLDPASPIQ